MFRSLLCAALLCAPSIASAADQTGEVDWSRKVIKARGQGAPDLSAPSVSSARLGAEGAAKGDALRNLLETLKGVELQSGDKLGTLLQQDSALSARVQGVLRGFKVVDKHYFADGGCSVDVEVEIDKLPDELKSRLKAPAAGAKVEAKAEAAASPPYQANTGVIDWSRKVIKARGQGLPDLNAATIASARQKAERAARIDAVAQLLAAVKGASTGDATADVVIAKDDGLRAKVDGALRGYKIVAPHYYSDGGVALDVEVAFDNLPSELVNHFQAPKAP